MADETSAGTTRLAFLRARTRAAHARVERVPMLARLLAPDLTRDEYISVLLAMHGFHAAIEPVIAAALRTLPPACQLLDGAALGRLAADLAWFGVQPASRLPRVPALASVHAGLGALYVVEGANLGGRVIARRVADTLGVSAGRGGSFYGSLSAEMARERWQALCAVVETPPRGPADEAAAAGAGAVFDCLEAWMRTVSRSSS